MAMQTHTSNLKISVVTPSYNQGQYIEQTINSILDQQYSNLEYLVLDGGSTDNTLSVINKYEQGHFFWESQKDKGQSDAINKGFQLATGDIINWLNSDDYYEKGSLHYVANQFQDPKVNCYTGTSRIFGEERCSFSSGTDVYTGNLYKTIGWARIDQPETFFRKSVIDEIGYLNECLHFVMDKDLWIRYLCKYGLDNIKKDKQLLVHFRLHNESKTVSLKEKFEQETINLFYTYACNMELHAYIGIFEALWAVKLLPLEFFPEGLAKQEWELVLNYFLLYKCFEAYAQNEYEMVKQLLKVINKEQLQTVDQKEFEKVKLRVKYLPIGVKRILNRIRY